MTTKIKICMGSACFARGNAANLQILENHLKKQRLDAKIELVGTRCENECALGPNITIDAREYHALTGEKLAEIIKQLK